MWALHPPCSASPSYTRPPCRSPTYESTRVFRRARESPDQALTGAIVLSDEQPPWCKTVMLSGPSKVPSLSMLLVGTEQRLEPDRPLGRVVEPDSAIVDAEAPSRTSSGRAKPVAT